MLKVILADATVIEVQDIHLAEPALILAVPDRAAFLNAWDQMNPTALDHVEIYQEETKLAAYCSCEIQNIQLVLNYDGSMVAYFYLAGEALPYADPAYEQAFKILAGDN